MAVAVEREREVGVTVAAEREVVEQVEEATAVEAATVEAAMAAAAMAGETVAAATAVVMVVEEMAAAMAVVAMAVVATEPSQGQIATACCSQRETSYR